MILHLKDLKFEEPAPNYTLYIIWIMAVHTAPITIPGSGVVMLRDVHIVMQQYLVPVVTWYTLT